MERGKRVLFLIRAFHPPWATGATSYAKGLLESTMMIEETETTIISTLDEFTASKFSRVRTSDINAFTEMLQIIRQTSYFKGNKSSIEILRLVRKFNNPQKFDVIHIVYSGITPFPLILSLRRPKDALIIKHIYGPAENQVRATLTKKFYEATKTVGAKAFERIKISFPSQYAARTYGYAPFDNNCLIIPPAINTKLYAPIGKVDKKEVVTMLNRAHSKVKVGLDNILNNDCTILYMGWLLYQRLPYDIVLSALKMLLKKLDFDVTLLIIGRESEAYGEENYARKLIDYASQLGLRRNITLSLQELSEREKIMLLNYVDVILQPYTGSMLRPSIVDPPISILESMACAKPVVVSRTFSLPTILKHGENGYLIESLNDECLANTLYEALNSSSKVREAARKTIIKDFSTMKVSSILENIMSRY